VVLVLLAGGGVGGYFLVKRFSAGKTPRGGKKTAAAPARPAPQDPGPDGSVQWAQLTVTTGRTNAVYRIGDAIVGSGAKLHLKRLKSGMHTLVIDAEGYVSDSRKLNLEPGAAVNLNITLKPRTARRTGRPSSRGRRPTRDDPTIWRDGPCRRKIPPRLKHVFEYKFGRAWVNSFGGTNAYDGRRPYHLVNPKLIAITACFRKFVRCKPELWRSGVELNLSPTGKILRIRPHMGSKQVGGCIVKILRSIRWPSPIGKKGGQLDYYFTVRRSR
jgi:hypothetical protein